MFDKTITIKELIKDNEVQFDNFYAGNFYYTISYNNETYIFPVPLDDTGTAKMNSKDKAILFMRWVRKSIDNNTIVKK